MHQSPLLKKLILCIGITLVLASTPLHAEEVKQPRGATEPASVRPGEKLTFMLQGFAPNSTLTVADGDKQFEDFFGGNNRTDENGSFTKTISIPIYASHVFGLIPFQDEKGNRAEVFMDIKGPALKPFLFGVTAAYSEGRHRMHITGVGWSKNAKTNITAFDPRTNELRELTIADNCAANQCTRDDALDRTALFSQETIPGEHIVIITQDGSPERFDRTVVLPPRTGITPDAQKKPHITAINPPAATADIPSLAVFGEGWGNYDERRFVRAWLINPENKNERLELKVDRNYRDCYILGSNAKIFFTGEGCFLETDQMFLRVELPAGAQEWKEGDYLVYILTENGLDAAAPFRLVKTPDMRKAEKPTLVSTPAQGQIGTFVVLTAGGFPKRTGLVVRFDGVKIQGTPITDDEGFFTDVGITIPASIEKDKKFIITKPGKHTIEVVDFGGSKKFALASFTVTLPDEEKKKEERLKKEHEEKIRKEKEEKERKEKELKDDFEKLKKIKEEEERVKKEKERLEKLEKQKEEERKKKEEQGKKKDVQKIEQELEKIEKKKEVLQDKKEDLAEKKKKLEQEKKEDEKTLKDLNESLKITCVASIPRYLQPGCSKPIQNAFPETAGKPCRDDMALTFQPGCISQPRVDSAKPFFGRTCDQNLPLVWQEGCVQQQKQQEIPPTFGRACRDDVAITFQPGCVSQQKKELGKPSQGKPCDPNLPLVWQEGCAQQKRLDELKTPTQSQKTPTTPQKCNPLIPAYSQRGCQRIE